MRREYLKAGLLPIVVLHLAVGTAMASGDCCPASTPSSGLRIPASATPAPDQKPSPATSQIDEPALAPLAGVTDIKLGEIFKTPIGPKGLEYTDRAKSLDGKKVRVAGFMVEQETPMRGVLILAPMPIHTHDEEMGLADDLPASIMYCLTSDREFKPAFTRGKMLLTGTLRLGSREEADGRVSWARLELDAPAVSTK